MTQRFLFLLAFLVFVGTAHAQTGERILGFHSQIDVHEDGSMTVRETIRVYAQGQQIRRGIYRDFPTSYRDAHGNRIVVDFNVQEVLRDGSPEPYHTRRLRNGVRVYFGHEDRQLSRGEHVYTFTYRTAQQLGYFDEHDELYWNVTGNGWGFQIDSASARIVLPEGIAAADITVEGYTGKYGSTETSYVAEVDGPSTAKFAATKPLAPGEGLTIVVAFPKGFVAQPTVAQKIELRVQNRSGDLAVLGGTLLVLGLYVIVWLRVGIDPPKGHILPTEHPPEGLSPAALRYIQRMGPDPKTFSVALIAMAVKRYLQIDHQGGKNFSILRGDADESALTTEERAIADSLFDGRDSIELDQKNHGVIGRARSACFRVLGEELKGEYFNRNAWYLLLGILLSVAALAAGLAVSQGNPSWIFAFCAVVLIATSILFGFLLKAPTREGRRVLDEIEGFRMYLNGDGMARFSPQAEPEALGRHFEQFLPFAIALNMESPWADEFTRALSTTAPQQHTHAYYPVWYHGAAWDTAGAQGFTSSLSGTFAGVVTASSIAPGSSSGGGGGGFSGGGGDGGGGGGW